MCVVRKHINKKQLAHKISQSNEHSKNNPPVGGTKVEEHG